MLTAARVKVAPGKLLIGGEWRHASHGEVFETINPATAEVLAQVAEAGSEDVGLAVSAARRAFDDTAGPWRRMSASERGRLLWKIADAVEKDIDELAELETLDNGKPIFESRYIDMPMIVDVLRYYAGWATKIYGETVNTFENAFTYTLREPIGVVGAIVAWNYPLLLASWKLAPALACGNEDTRCAFLPCSGHSWVAWDSRTTDFPDRIIIPHCSVRMQREQSPVERVPRRPRPHHLRSAPFSIPARSSSGYQ